MEHICVADGNAFNNKNIPDQSHLAQPEVYFAARDMRRQMGAIHFDSAIHSIAHNLGLQLTREARVAIQGGIVCAVAGCQVNLIKVPQQDLQMSTA